MKLGVIPARLYSTRFIKKILADINGKPMVIHTAERVSKCKNLDRFIIAIDNNETFEAIKDYGFETMMTSDSHKSGTDRVAEVVEKIKEADVVVNIQADEPFIDPTLIDELVKSFEDSNIEMSTLVSTQLLETDMKDKNVVKAVLDNDGFAKDFNRIFGDYKHLGIYGFTRDTLLKFVSLKQSDREKNRKLEQMRALDNGIKIKSIVTDKNSFSIDTKEDLEHIQYG